jgi:hypothetical protein
MPEEPQMTPEEKAAEALIAYSLSHADAENYSEEELLASSQGLALTEEDKEVLRKIGPAFFSEGRIEETAKAEPILEFAGMYRLGSDQELDEKVREEMEAKRKELLEKIKAKKKKDV